MHPFTKLLVLVALATLVLWALGWLRNRRAVDSGRPVPVRDLPQAVREAIDHQILVRGKKSHAVKIYRDSTKAPLSAAMEAVNVRERELGR